jgi:YXWGXW repeat-containing protein
MTLSRLSAGRPSVKPIGRQRARFKLMSKCSTVQAPPRTAIRPKLPSPSPPPKEERVGVRRSQGSCGNFIRCSAFGVPCSMFPRVPVANLPICAPQFPRIYFPKPPRRNPRNHGWRRLAESKKIMKKLTFGILPVIASALLSGCAPHHEAMVVTTAEPVTTTRTTRTVVVNEAPPEPRVEVEGPAPSASHVWIQGYWTHIDNHWVWSPGHWEMRPRVNAMWIPGHWDKDPSGKGWIWTAGHWE